MYKFTDFNDNLSTNKNKLFLLNNILLYLIIMVTIGQKILPTMAI